MMLNRRVDGLILGDARATHAGRDPPFAGVAYVLTNRRVEGHPSVTGDDTMGGRLVAKHLLGLGHTRVAVAAGAAYASTGIDRTTGFLEDYAQAGPPRVAGPGRELALRRRRRSRGHRRCSPPDPT